MFEPLSRKATQLAMGPWYVRDADRPFMPGFSVTVLKRQIVAGRVKPDTVLRGPTTNQFWMRADQTPGVSRLLGKCHACASAVATDATACGKCKADLTLPKDVDRLGLSYTTPADRAQAQAEIDALRAGKPAPPKPSKPVAVKVDPTYVEPDLLKPIQPARTAAPAAGDHDEAGHAGGFDPDAHDHDAEPAEDLWDAAASTPIRRRKRRRNGPGPLALGLGLLLIGSVAGGGYFAFSKLRNPADDGASPTGDRSAASAPVQRSAEDVGALSAAVLAEYDRVRQSDSVPEPFRGRFDAIARAVDQGQRDTSRKKYSGAYASFAEAQALLGPLVSDIAAWEADQAARREVAELRTAARASRARAESLDGKAWSSAAWAEGEASLGQAELLVNTGKASDAAAEFRRAETAFDRAAELAEAGVKATAAREALDASMKAGLSEQALRAVASNQVDRLLSKRADGERQMQTREYASAERSFNEAARALQDAETAVERARYRKVYAFNAGYLAADLLIAVAAGDGVPADKHATLVETFDTLALPTNPAEALRPGDEAEYRAAADALVNDARDAIKSTHSNAAQACYNAGFQARIIGQTLQSPALTGDQQKRAHQSLNALQDQAAAAGWDILAMRDAVERVRTMIRNADLGKPPERAREAWATLVKPMMRQDTALRLMDPVTPSNAPDPELFPGLGSAG